MKTLPPYSCSDGFRLADGIPVKSGKTDGKTQHGNRAFVVKAGATTSTIKPAGHRQPIEVPNSTLKVWKSRASSLGFKVEPAEIEPKRPDPKLAAVPAPAPVETKPKTEDGELRVWSEGVKAFVCRGGHDVEYEFTTDPTRARVFATRRAAQATINNANGYASGCRIVNTDEALDLAVEQEQREELEQHQELPPPSPEPATEIAAAIPARTEQHVGADLSLTELLALLASKTESRLDEIDAELRKLDAKRKALTDERENLRHLAGGVA